MKHIMFILLLVLFGVTSNTTAMGSQVNDTIKYEAKAKSSSYEKTGDVVVYKGQTYDLYKHTFTKGKRAGQTGYFIRRTSAKTGKEYWYELKDVKASK